MHCVMSNISTQLFGTVSLCSQAQKIVLSSRQSKSTTLRVRFVSREHRPAWDVVPAASPADILPGQVDTVSASRLSGRWFEPASRRPTVLFLSPSATKIRRINDEYTAVPGGAGAAWVVVFSSQSRREFYQLNDPGAAAKERKYDGIPRYFVVYS